MIQVLEFLIDSLQFSLILHIALMILEGKDYQVKKSSLVFFAVLQSSITQVARQVFTINLQLELLYQLILILTSYMILIYLTKKIKLKALGLNAYILLLSLPIYILTLAITDIFKIENFLHIGLMTSLVLTPYYYFLSKILASDQHEKKFDKIVKAFDEFSWLFILVTLAQPIYVFASTFTTKEAGKIAFFIANFFYIFAFSFLLLLAYFIKKLMFDQLQLEEQVSSLSENTATINSLYKDSQQYQDEVSKVIQSISTYVDHKDYETLSEKIISNTHTLNEISLKGFEPLMHLKQLHIPSVKGLVFNKYHHAMKSGVVLNMGIIEKLEDLSVGDVDLCRMVGILLDNAIEAAEDAIDKKVHVTFDKVNHQRSKQWQIQIENSYNGQAIATDLSGKWKSSKGSKRGLGLKSLKTILRKYNHISLESVLDKESITQILIFKL